MIIIIHFYFALNAQLNSTNILDARCVRCYVICGVLCVAMCGAQQVAHRDEQNEHSFIISLGYCKIIVNACCRRGLKCLKDEHIVLKRISKRKYSSYPLYV